MPPQKPRSDYITTETGNKVSRRNLLQGTQHITLAGRSVIHSDVCIRGDLIRQPPTSSTTAPQPPTTSVTLGRYTILSPSTLLRPPSRLSHSTIQYTPLRMGDHTYIGPNCVIEAATIGDHVHIGAGVVVGKGCIIKDWVKVLEGSVVAPGTVVVSGVVVGGRPARVVGDVGEGWGVGEGVEGGDLRGRWREVG